MKQDEEKNKEIKKRVEEEPDFINSKKYKYSLKEYKKNSKGPASDNIIAYFLCVTPQEVQQIYNNAVNKIRQYMKIDL